MKFNNQMTPEEIHKATQSLFKIILKNGDIKFHESSCTFNIVYTTEGLHSFHFAGKLASNLYNPNLVDYSIDPKPKPAHRTNLCTVFIELDEDDYDISTHIGDDLVHLPLLTIQIRNAIKLLESDK